jgi:hypothetical protein
MKLSNLSEIVKRIWTCLAAVTLIITASAIQSTVIVQAQTQRAKRPRTVSASPVAEASITLNEQFVNSFLEAMFTKLREPEFPLSIVQNSVNDDTILTAHASSNPSQGCASVVVLERERNGVKTEVHFEEGRITAPLAFSGSYNTGLLGCLTFNGWASSVVTLEFDKERQAVMARVRVQDVQLYGIPRLAGGVVVNLVQSSIDRRFNPYELFKAEQLSPIVPIKAAGGSLRLRAKEMRPEIVPGALRIHVIFDFERVG